MMTRFATNDSYILRLLSLSSSRLLGSILTQLHETVSKEATHVLNSDLTKRLCRLAVELWGFLLRQPCETRQEAVAEEVKRKSRPSHSRARMPDLTQLSRCSQDLDLWRTRHRHAPQRCGRGSQRLTS